MIREQGSSYAHPRNESDAQPGPGSGQFLLRTTNATAKRFRPFLALLTCAGIALSVATARATADPSPFGSLCCSCNQPVSGPHRPDAQQIMQGIRDGAPNLHHHSSKPSE